MIASSLNRYFNIVYMMSGRYRVRYIARVISWENRIIRIRDKDQKEHTLKEEHIRLMKPTIPTQLKVPIPKKESKQQELFSEDML